jgi:hypothetical protein
MRQERIEGSNPTLSATKSASSQSFFESLRAVRIISRKFAGLARAAASKWTQRSLETDRRRAPAAEFLRD